MCFVILIVSFSSGAFSEVIQCRLRLSVCPFREVLCVLLSGALWLSPAWATFSSNFSCRGAYLTGWLVVFLY